MTDFDAAEQAVRAAMSKRFPKAWERAKAGHDAKTAQISLKPGRPTTPTNQRIIAEAIEALDFPPRGPAVWSMSRAGDTHFIITAWRSF